MENNEKIKNLSLAGCGFMGIYHIGVIKAFKEYKPEYLNQIAGSSCGALIGACFLSNCSLDQVAKIFSSLAIEGRSYILGPFNPRFDLPKILRKLLNETLPHNAHTLCTNRLHVSITRASDAKNVIINKFNTREDLIQVLICSSFVPVYSGYKLPLYENIAYYDGCWSDNNPSIDDNTLLVAPFMGESDICPKMESAGYHLTDFQNTSVLWCFENVNRALSVFLPPDQQMSSEVYYIGYRDALYYIKLLDFQARDTVNADFKKELIKSLNKHDKSEFKFGPENSKVNNESICFLRNIFISSLLVLILYYTFLTFLI